MCLLFNRHKNIFIFLTFSEKVYKKICRIICEMDLVCWLNQFVSKVIFQMRGDNFMEFLKHVTDLSVEEAETVKGGKTCSCSCSCSCSQSNVTADTKSSNKSASAASTFAGGSQPW